MVWIRYSWFFQRANTGRCIDQKPHDEIAYKGSRGNLGKILKHVGLLKSQVGEDLGQLVSRLIANRHGRFHFGSLIRCTVE